jgi:signal transduction histidine kinase
LIINNIEIFKKKHNEINFEINIDEKIWFMELDKVQIKQVIDNLVNNSIKFSDTNNPHIRLNTYIDNWSIYIEVEDNWKTFKDIDITNLFKKYSTWKNYWIWLWMWLYLCKKIIELHNWNIYCSLSKLWWAKFTIRLPYIFKKKLVFIEIIIILYIHIFMILTIWTY